MKNLDLILAKGEENRRVTLVQHLSEVAILAEKVAHHLGLDTSIARKGAILHDIGKTSYLFQKHWKRTFTAPDFVSS
jgi:CRISPR-associated endonuclease/helicase Cas3